MMRMIEEGTWVLNAMILHAMSSMKEILLNQHSHSGGTADLESLPHAMR